MMDDGSASSLDSSKRSFLKLIFFTLNGALGLLLGVPVLGYVLVPLWRKRVGQWVEAGPAKEFAVAEPQPRRLSYTSGSGFREVEASRNVWIFAEGEALTAFSSECTHVGCNVVWKPRQGEGEFFCPCHGGRFSRTGVVLGGPPPAPLKRLSTKIENGNLYIEI